MAGCSEADTSDNGSSGSEPDRDADRGSDSGSCHLDVVDMKPQAKKTKPRTGSPAVIKQASRRSVSYLCYWHYEVGD